MAMQFKEYELGYTNSDDGVWIKHSRTLTDAKQDDRGCGWQKCLGFFASLSDAVLAAEQHDRESH